MNPQKLLRRLVRGSVRNVAFEDLLRLVQAFGFELQIRQFLRLVERYALSLEDRA